MAPRVSAEEVVVLFVKALRSATDADAYAAVIGNAVILTSGLANAIQEEEDRRHGDNPPPTMLAASAHTMYSACASVGLAALLYKGANGKPNVGPPNPANN